MKINLIEIKRLVSYMAIAFVTIMVIFMMFLLEFNPWVALFFGFFISLFVAFLSWFGTSNVFTRIVSGSDYGVMVIGSGGSIKFYTATIAGDRFVSYIDGQRVEQKFNRNLFWYVSQKIIPGILRKIRKEGEEKNKIIFETNVPDNLENLSSEIFKTDFPFLVYVPAIESFVTKEWFFKREYDSMLFNFGWELKHSIDAHNKSAGGITRHILDLIAAKGKDPQFKKFMMMFLFLIIGILLLVLFGPTIYEIMNTAIADPGQAEQLLGTKLT